MVSQKSTKTAKSYKQRGLTALVQLNNDKTRAIHPNTLRNQVYKTASARGDQLGPAWKKWTRKGLEKLNELGITQSSPSGSVSLTPRGKKCIADTKRDLGIDWEPSPREADEIAQTILKKGTKRTRALSFSGDETPTKRAKRPKGSTKAEISGRLREREAEVRDLRNRVTSLEKTEKHVHPYLRGVSPLSDLDSDEEDEADDTLQIDELQTPLVPSSPTVVPSLTFSTPRPPIDPLTRTRSLLGLERIQSGSFISQISKQPTPAPSSAGSDFGDLNDFPMADNNDDVFSQPAQPRAHFESGLATPETTPSRPGSGQSQSQLVFGPSASVVSKEVELLKELERCQTEAREKEAENLRTITSLNEQLATRSTELDQIQARLVLVNTDVASKEGELSMFRTQIENLLARQAHLQASEADLTCHQTELRTQLVESTTRIDGLETRLTERTNQVETLRSEVFEKESELQKLCEELDSAKTLAETRLTELETARQDLTKVQDSLDAVQFRLNNVDSENKSLLDQLALSATNMSSQAQLLSSAEQRVAELQGEVASKNSELAQLHIKSERFSNEVEAVRGELTRAKAQYEEQLTQLRLTVSSLSSQLATAQAENTTLHDSLSTSQTLTETLLSDLATQAAKHAEESLRLSTLLEDEVKKHAEKERQLAELMKALKETEGDYDELWEKKAEDENTIRLLKAEAADSARRMTELMQQLSGRNQTVQAAQVAATPRKARRSERFTL